MAKAAGGPEVTKEWVAPTGRIGLFWVYAFPVTLNLIWTPSP
jgi:hypothetical protein